MTWIEKAKIGDKVRYLGGDPSDRSELYLMKNHVYEIKRMSCNEIIIENERGYLWGIGEGAENIDCFELVESESPKTTEDLIASLAQTVTQLERELNALKIKYEIDREMFIKDIAMIDERTHPAESNIVRKTVTYEYEH